MLIPHEKRIKSAICKSYILQCLSLAFPIALVEMIPAAVTAGAEMDFSTQKGRLMALQTLEEASSRGDICIVFQ